MIKNHFQIATHMNKRQTGHYGKLYLHAKTEINGGVDLCLSKKAKDKEDDYYLSFLIKASFINEEFCKQQKACGKINALNMTENEMDEITFLKKKKRIVRL